ncbi:MAG: hypothetical protein ACLUAM_08230 [Bifidobacterium adolescentis]
MMHATLLLINYNEKHPNNKIEFEGATEKSATVADVLKAVGAGKYDAAIYPYTSFQSIKDELGLDLTYDGFHRIVPNGVPVS